MNEGRIRNEGRKDVKEGCEGSEVKQQSYTNQCDVKEGIQGSWNAYGNLSSAGSSDTLLRQSSTAILCVHYCPTPGE